MATHDLTDFIDSIARQVSEEYKRIQKRACEDPGTAGDQGEENWASLLRGWLPHTMRIVTKGRILSEKGVASPQVDIIVLSPEYPSYLLDKKLYLAGGVLAAFECKTTLKASHIKSFIANSIEIKDHSVNELGTPYKELQSPILYGLLAHSHSWKSSSSKPIEIITEKLLSCDEELVAHPRQMPDLVCVGDLACWSTSKATYIGPHIGNMEWKDFMTEIYGSGGCALSYYNCHSGSLSSIKSFNPIGAFIYCLISKMAKRSEALRPLARYYQNTLSVGSEGVGRKWPISIYSEEIQLQVMHGRRISTEPYNDWCFLCD